ncbi:HD domain-containing phosphohydrolase [Nitrospira sp. M1]
MPEKILFVDDSRNVLDAYKRQFRKGFEVDTALGSEWGIEKLSSDGPFAVVVSDFRMPNVDGIEFLKMVKAQMPDASRILITGYADVETAMKAVNDGAVFRFLSKPCPHELLLETIQAGLEHHRLLRAERDILERTLNGCLKSLIEVFSLSNPEAFGRTSRIQRYMKGMTRPMGVDCSWLVETAALLSQIGTVTMPQEVLRKQYRGEPLTSQEEELFFKHPQIGGDLLEAIPRMEEVAKIIRFQEKRYDGSGPPMDSSDQGREIPVEARMLKVVLDFDTLETGGMEQDAAMYELRKREGWYDPILLDALKQSFEKDKKYAIMELSLEGLTSGMILAEGVRDETGKVIISKGQQLTDGLLMHLMHLAHQRPIQEPIKVIVPLAEGAVSTP